jgi:ABC-type phosphate/phosphonate transport system permease subunit
MCFVYVFVLNEEFFSTYREKSLFVFSQQIEYDTQEKKKKKKKKKKRRKGTKWDLVLVLVLLLLVFRFYSS